MSRLLVAVLAALVAFFLLTNFVPTAFLVLLIFTFGLAFPLLFLNTVLLYFLAALPAIVLLRNKSRIWMAIALAASVVGVAVGVPLATEALSARRMQQLQADDIEARLPDAPRSIEIVGEERHYVGSNDPLKSAPCDALCQRLLLSRRVDVVRVTRTGTARPAPPKQLDYVIEQRDNCPNAFGDGEEMLPETKDAIVSGTCFVAREPSARALAAKVLIRKTSTSDPADLVADLASAGGTANDIQQLEISTATPDGWSLKLRQTQVKYSYWTMPLYITLAPCYGMCLGRPVFGRTTRTLNPFNPVEVALHALRLASAEPQARLSPAERVMAMLDHTGEDLTDNQKQLIRDWTTGLSCSRDGCPTLSDIDKTVTLRLVRDRRVTDFIFIGPVIGRSRDLIVDNFDLFLDEMEGRGANSQFSNVIGALVAQLDNDVVRFKDVVRSKGERVLVLIRENHWTWSRGIGIISGRLGIDTTTLIAERLGRPPSAATAALAACLADDDIGQALVPSLLAYLRADPASNHYPDRADRDVVKALARFGHLEEAKEAFLARFPKTGEHAFPLQSASEVVRNVKACLWS